MMDLEERTAGFDLSHLHTEDADDIIALAEIAIFESLKAYGHDDERAQREAEESAESIFVGYCGLHRTGIVREDDDDFPVSFGDRSVFMNEEVLSTALECAKAVNQNLSDWILRAIHEKAVRQTADELESLGLIKRNGEYRNGEPVFVDATLFKKMN